MKIISNSEITTYNICKKLHQLSYGLGVTPKHIKDSYYRGSMGHQALDVYYSYLKQSEFPNDVDIHCAKEEALLVLKQELTRVTKEEPESTNRIKILSQLNTLIKDYAAHYKTEPFRVLETEKTYTAPITEELEFGLILDLLVEFTAGPYRGDIVVIDHKFVYNFKSTAELEMDAQLPKYIKAVRENGYYVTKGIFNQIRYRTLKAPSPTDIFQRTEVRVNKTSIDNIWRENRHTAVEIHANPAKPVRTLSPIVCKYCDFQELCKAELSGLDITNMLAANYKKRERPLEVLVSDD
jgi:hypothetical protein